MTDKQLEEFIEEGVARLHEKRTAEEAAKAAEHLAKVQDAEKAWDKARNLAKGMIPTPLYNYVDWSAWSGIEGPTPYAMRHLKIRVPDAQEVTVQFVTMPTTPVKVSQVRVPQVGLVEYDNEWNVVALDEIIFESDEIQMAVAEAQQQNAVYRRCARQAAERNAEAAARRQAEREAEEERRAEETAVEVPGGEDLIRRALDRMDRRGGDLYDGQAERLEWEAQTLALLAIAVELRQLRQLREAGF